MTWDSRPCFQAVHVVCCKIFRIERSNQGFLTHLPHLGRGNSFTTDSNIFSSDSNKPQRVKESKSERQRKQI